MVYATIVNKLMIWWVLNWKTRGYKHLIFIILTSNLSIFLLFSRFSSTNNNFMSKLIAFATPYIRSLLAFEWWMIYLLQCWHGGNFLLKFFPLFWNWLVVNLLLEAWFVLNFFLSFSESWCLPSKALFAKRFYLISLHCSWAYKAFKSSVNIIVL